MTKENLSQGEWFFGIAVLVTLVILVSVLSPTANVTEEFTVGQSQEVTFYQAIACFAVIVAAVLGSELGKRVSSRRLVSWLTAVICSAPLGWWISYRLAEAGYSEYYFETTVIVIILSGFLVIPSRSRVLSDES